MAHFWKHSITVTPTLDPVPGEKAIRRPRLGDMDQIAARILVSRRLPVISLRVGVSEPLVVELAVPKLSDDFAADASAVEDLLNDVANGRDVAPLPAPQPGRTFETV